MEYKQKLLDLFSYTKRKNKQLSIMVEKKEKYLSMGDDEFLFIQILRLNMHTRNLCCQ